MYATSIIEPFYVQLAHFVEQILAREDFLVRKLVHYLHVFVCNVLVKVLEVAGGPYDLRVFLIIHNRKTWMSQVLTH